MSSTTSTGRSHAWNTRAYAYGYSRTEQMLAGHNRTELIGYLQTWKGRLERAEFGSPAYAVALGAWTYLTERLGTGSCRRTARSRRTARRYSVRGSKW